MEKLPEAVDAILEWRTHQDLQTTTTDEEDEDEDDLDIIRCLCPPAQDHLGRPIVLVKLSNVQGTAQELKQYFLSHAERLRLALIDFNEESGSDDPVLQYTFIVDIANAGGMNVVWSPPGALVAYLTI